MTDCVILINDRLVSLSHTTHSSFNPQLLLSLVHPSESESWSEWSGMSGLLKGMLKKTSLFTEFLTWNISWYLSMISLTEGLYASLLTIIENMPESERESGSTLTSESCPDREKTYSTLDSVVKWHTVCLKTTKFKGNRIRSCLNLNRLSHFGLQSTTNFSGRL